MASMPTSAQTVKPRPRDAEATKARILEGASDEFADLGLAGARIDRIAERADVNKRMIYAYFGGKERLFEAVVDRHLSVVTEQVPFTAEDLSGYAGALFDAIAANRRALRLVAWRNFEHPHPTASELASYKEKLRDIKRAQRAGTIDKAPAAEDVLALVMGMVTSWLLAAPALTELAAGDPESPARLRRHRRALVEAVRRSFAPGPEAD
jgi:AcrR family transcriptional regulator